jgi:hypothetical protein
MQGSNAVAIGNIAGSNRQGADAVAIGVRAGTTSQGSRTVAIGLAAGETSQGSQATAVGDQAGQLNQGAVAVGVGLQAGQLYQGNLAVAVGYAAGFSSQGSCAVAIGPSAGQGGQGRNAVAIGYFAGFTGQASNSIIISAGGGQADNTQTGSTIIFPIRGLALTTPVMSYNTGTGEIRYNSSSIRYKTNVTDATVDTSAIYDVRLREFDAKTRGNTDPYYRFVGYVAEEVANVDPHFAGYDAQGRPDTIEWFNMMSYGLTELRNLRDGATYAEYYEASSESEMPQVGETVVLADGTGKIRVATPEDSASDILGVVRPKRPTQVTVPNAAENEWIGKFLKNDFGAFVMESHDLIEWTETIEVQAAYPAQFKTIQHEYQSDAIPEGVVVPEDAVTDSETGAVSWTEVTDIEEMPAQPAKTQIVSYKFQSHALPPGIVVPADAVVTPNAGFHRALNPAYDPEQAYVPRSKRAEWVQIALMGRAPVLANAPKGPAWKKVRDVSADVEEWVIAPCPRGWSDVMRIESLEARLAALESHAE